MAFRFPPEFLDQIHNCWPEIVEWLNSHRDKLTSNMRAFLDNISNRKREPSITQLALLISLLCNIEFQLALEGRQKEKASRTNESVPTNDNVVDIRRYKRKRSAA